VNGESASLPSEILTRVRRNMVLFPGQILISSERPPFVDHYSFGFVVLSLGQCMSLGHPRVWMGLSMENPRVTWPTDPGFETGQVLTDLGEAICRGKYLSQVLAKSIYIFSRLGSKNHMEFPDLRFCLMHISELPPMVFKCYQHAPTHQPLHPLRKQSLSMLPAIKSLSHNPFELP